jgi:hypothetical protein
MSVHIPADPFKAAALVRDTTTPIAVLEALAQSPLTFLKEGVAQHPNATPELLSRMAPKHLKNDTDFRMAMALVANPITPPSVLATLLQHLEPEEVNGSHRENHGWEILAVKLLCHRNCPVSEAAAFLSSTHLPREQKVHIVERTPVNDILALLTKDTSEHVRNKAAMRLNGM